MIDFTKYTQQELQAIIEVLDYLTEDMPDLDNGYHVAICYYSIACSREAEMKRRSDNV